MTLSTAIVVLCTVPNIQQAELLANKAIQKKLAACITVIPGATSYYLWRGQRKMTNEVQMLLKSDITHQVELVKLLKTEHSYEVPEILVLPIQNTEKEYLSWINSSLQ